ncbi:MAG: hypothetical protein JWM73_2693 [Solirubrobacterales bacterium]|nr:hypothetical protein [Solirubrobacterales bacterium]
MTDRDALAETLARLGRDPAARERVVRACREIEATATTSRSVIRETLTGPIVDALHRDTAVVSKTLSSGLTMSFLYRSKIARDFVLSERDEPDHVWEPQTTRTLLQLAKGAGHVVVGGAYFGDQAVLLAAAIRSHGGCCHAFEPDPQQCAVLAHNAVDNELGNLRVHTTALWSDESALLQLRGADAYATTVPAAPGAGPTVAATTIDAYLDRERIERVELIALDLEGAELAALRGARRRLEAPAGEAPHLVFEVHRRYVDWSAGLESTAILRHLAALGYHAFAIRDSQSNRDLSGLPVELIPARSVYTGGPPHGFNMVAVKDPAVLAGEPFAFAADVSPKLLPDGDPALHHPGAAA